MIGEGRVVGIDLGSRRIGIAVTDSGQSVATGAATVERCGDRAADHRAIRRIVVDYEAVGAVVGVPVALSGEIGPAAGAVLAEIEELRVALPVIVDTIDERLTTVAASGAMRAAGRSSRQQRRVIDQAAAAVLLQTWLDRRRSQRDPSTTAGEPTGTTRA